MLGIDIFDFINFPEDAFDHSIHAMSMDTPPLSPSRSDKSPSSVPPTTPPLDITTLGFGIYYPLNSSSSSDAVSPIIPVL